MICPDDSFESCSPRQSPRLHPAGLRAIVREKRGSPSPRRRSGVRLLPWCQVNRYRCRLALLRQNPAHCSRQDFHNIHQQFPPKLRRALHRHNLSQFVWTGFGPRYRCGPRDRENQVTSPARINEKPRCCQAPRFLTQLRVTLVSTDVSQASAGSTLLNPRTLVNSTLLLSITDRQRVSDASTRRQ